MKKNTYFDLQLFLVQNRTLITVLTTSFSSLSLGLFLLAPFPEIDNMHWLFLAGFILSNALLVVASVTPKYYERLKFIEELFPIIHSFLKLDESSRVTIHHIRNNKNQLFEQVTNYYPTSTGKGRLFNFTQGITGQAFKTRKPQCYSIEAQVPLRTDYQDRWSFTQEEISRLAQDRRSFLAIPIGLDGEYAKAVLYMDSGIPGMFAVENQSQFVESINEYFMPLLNKLLDSDSTANKVLQRARH